MPKASDLEAPERRCLNLWPDVARMLGLSRGGVYNAAKRGDLRTIRVGGRILVPRTALDRLIDGDEICGGAGMDAGE